MSIRLSAPAGGRTCGATVSGYGGDTSDVYADGERLLHWLMCVTLLPAVFAGYMLPTLIARARSHHNAVPIRVVNYFFRWALSGYVGVLAWSHLSPSPAHIHHYHGPAER